MHHPTAFLARAGSRLGLLLLLAMSGWLMAGCSQDGDDAVPLQITAQPADTSVTLGAAATLSVQAQGSALSYQWQRSADGGATWADVAGATADRLVTAPTSAADNGVLYRVVVSAAGVSLTSSSVRLTVTAVVVAPALTVQPTAQTAVAPAAASFSITASGTAPRYQWQRSTDAGSTWVDIADANAPTYATGATTVAMDGEQFRVVVSNTAGSVTSAAVRLTVNPAPVAAAIATEPVDQAVSAGNAAVFTAGVSGTPAPTLQWQRSPDGGATWADVAGATAASLSTGTTTVAQDGHRYRLQASNISGSATSRAARLSVAPAPQAPTITTQPAGQSVTVPAAASFSVVATGVPAPSVQWQVSVDGGTTWANIVAATAADYTTPATAIGDNGKRYRAQLVNASGTVVSQAALLTVNPAPASAQWQTAQPLRPADAYSAERVVVAAGAAGQFVAAWLDTDASFNRLLRASRYTPGAGWSAAETVTAISASVNLQSHALVLDPAGNAVLIFTSRSNLRQSLWASRQTPSGPWSAPVLLETEDGGDAELAVLAVDAQGVATAVWQQNDTVFFPNSLATRRIVASRFVPGVGWDTPVDIDFTSGGNGTSLPIQVGASPGGNVVVSWTGSTPTGQVASAQVWRAGSGWVGAQRLVSDHTSTTQQVTGGVAINDAGLALVSFYRLPSTTSNLYVVRYLPASGWASPDLLAPNGAAASLVLAADGSASAAWENSPSGNTVFVARAPAGGAWSAPQAVFGGFGAQIGRDNTGQVTVAGLGISSPRTMLSVRWPAASAPLAAAVIESNTAVSSTFVRGGLAVSADGQAAAVWVEGASPDAVPWVNVFR